MAKKAQEKYINIAAGIVTVALAVVVASVFIAGAVALVRWAGGW